MKWWDDVRGEWFTGWCRPQPQVQVSLLTESFDVAVFTVYSVLMNVNDLFTLTHFHLFQLDIYSKYMYHISADSMYNS